LDSDGADITYCRINSPYRGYEALSDPRGFKDSKLFYPSHKLFERDPLITSYVHDLEHGFEHVLLLIVDLLLHL
jgi:hypothetical protein